MIFYFYGENSYGIKHQVGLIRKKYFEKTKQDADYLEIDLSEMSFENLLESVRVQPMFVSSRLIVANNLSKTKVRTEQVEKLITTTPESTNLVLTDILPDKRTSVFKKLSKLAGAKEFKNLNDLQLVKWLQTEAKNLRVDIDKKTAQYLVDRAGNDQWRLYNELQKLTGVEGRVTTEHIDQLVALSLEKSAFDLTDALVAKDLKRALNLYDNLRAQGQADQMIFGAIVYQYRMLLLAQINSSDLNKTYKASPYALRKASEKNGVDLETIKQAYLTLRKADIEIKTGKLSSTEGIRQLIAELCR